MDDGCFEEIFCVGFVCGVEDDFCVEGGDDEFVEFVEGGNVKGLVGEDVGVGRGVGVVGVDDVVGDGDDGFLDVLYDGVGEVSSVDVWKGSF